MNILKKWMIFLICFAVWLSCSGGSGSSGSGNPLKLTVTGDRTETISLTHIYAQATSLSTGDNDFSVRFSNPDFSSGFPALQFNVRNASATTGTFTGGASGETADIQLNFSSTDYYTTYNTYNFSVTVDEFSCDDGGISGTFTISDGGVLSTFSGSSTIAVSPATVDFYCSFVEDLADDDYYTPEEIQ